jgi:hypothetical protein
MDPIAPPPVHPEPTKSRRFGRLPRAAVAGGIAVGLALGGAGIAFAASSSSTTTPSSTPSAPKSPAPHERGHAFGHRFGEGGPDMGLGPVIHGQFTVPAGNGYRTVDIQVGTASARSSSSITVTSVDKYKVTYTVTAQTIVDAQRDGIGSIANGDQVRVLATTSKDVSTAISITDITKMGASRKQFGFGSAPGWAPRSGPGSKPGSAPGSAPHPAASDGWGTMTF